MLLWPRDWTPVLAMSPLCPLRLPPSPSGWDDAQCLCHFPGREALQTSAAILGPGSALGPQGRVLDAGSVMLVAQG